MKNKAIYWLVGSIAALMAMSACEDETSTIGSVLDRNEVTILVDSTFTLTGSTVQFSDFDPRNEINLLGRISVPEYGELNCSFMTQMLSASSLNVPDSINAQRVDSMKLMLKVPRGSLTGDSLAPQQAKVYKLKKAITADDNGNYNPDDLYSKEDLLGSRNFTLSALNRGDSIFEKAEYIEIPINLSQEFARKVFTDYRTDPAVFQWPETFAKYFPGIFVESSFGNGCIANVTKAEMVLYYYWLKDFTVPVDSVTNKTETRHMRDSVTLFASAPEVISVNNIHFSPSESIKAAIAAGQHILTTPAGYNVRIIFPLEAVLSKYAQNINTMTVVDNLTLSIPASTITNDYGIGVPPTLLMVKTSKINEFFNKNLTPDDLIAFTATYNNSEGTYNFTSMLEYFKTALKNDNIQPEDYDFTIIPVSFITEMKYVSYNKTEPVVIGANPYVTAPTMARLHLDRAKIKFTYSRQELN